MFTRSSKTTKRRVANNAAVKKVIKPEQKIIPVLEKPKVKISLINPPKGDIKPIVEDQVKEIKEEDK